MHTGEEGRKATLRWSRGRGQETLLPTDRFLHLCFYLSTPPPTLQPRPLPLSLSLPLDKGESHGGRLLTPPFLLSKQVILFSIPVSAVTVIICPLKKGHTHSGAMPEKPAREIVDADLAGKDTSDL